MTSILAFLCRLRYTAFTDLLVCHGKISVGLLACSIDARALSSEAAKIGSRLANVKLHLIDFDGFNMGALVVQIESGRVSADSH